MKKIHIDLSGPEGNAFWLLGKARQLHEAGNSQAKLEDLILEATRGNYAQLLNTLEKHFPGVFVFENDPRKSAQQKGERS